MNRYLAVALIVLVALAASTDARRRRRGGVSLSGTPGGLVDPNPGNGGSRSAETGRGEEAFVPEETDLSRSRRRAAASLPTAVGSGGPFDPLAVTGRHTYGSIPGRGFGWLANQNAGMPMPWFMPHTQQWSECDPAINPSCPPARPAFPPGSPMAQAAFGNAMQYASPSGWWTFHPAMSIRGQRDPLPSPVAPPVHPLSHYWALMHPASAGAFAHAAALNPAAAYYMPGGGFGGLGVPSAFAGATHPWVTPGAVAANPYQPGILGGYPRGALSAAPLASDAGAFGPYAFAAPHVLGSSFMPPHVGSGPSDPTGTGGAAPAGPFAAAPLFETLRAASSTTFEPIPHSSASLTAPWLSPGGHTAASADPGHALPPLHPAAPVFDRRNNAILTQAAYQQPADKMAPGPEFDAQKPAPAGP